MKTAQELREYTLKKLGQMAKKHGVAGWHAMNKDELSRALSRALRRKAAQRAAKASSNGKKSSANGKARSSSRNSSASRNGTTRRAVSAKRTTKKPAAKASASRNGSAKNGSAKNGTRKNGRTNDSRRRVNPATSQRIRQAQHNQRRHKSLATLPKTKGGRVRDRLVVMVRDPFWLHVYWELSRRGVERAQAAMGQEWHAAKPVLRLLEVCGGEGTSTVERPVRDIVIHGGVNNWYVDVKDPPKRYRLDIGYLGPSGRFFVLARSNVVSTPRAGTSDTLDSNWNDVAENFERIYAMNGGASDAGASAELEELFEEHLRRPLNVSTFSEYAASINGADRKPREFPFDVDAELIVFGTTEPDANVTLRGEPIDVRPDGTFTVRFSLPNCRQVIPAVARSRDGIQQRTIVLAVERNTKTMEPVVRDGHE